MTSIVRTKRNPAKAILFAWLLAATLDILAASTDYYIQSGKGPQGVLKFIASGIFGEAAFSGGSEMIWLGLLFHYIIVLVFTLFFYLLYSRLTFLHKSIFLTAVLYAIFTWSIMTLIVVPLSNTPKFAFSAVKAIKNIVILIFTIGLPLSIIIKNFFNKQTQL
ncbi:MAG: hypothetical protein ABJA35_11450 [Parafilimonas sp.]